VATTPPGACTLAVRPWALQAKAADAAAGAAVGVAPDMARVLAVHYLGQRLDVELLLDDGRHLTAALHEPADQVPVPGQRVSLGLHARGCAVLPAAGTLAA
jgi:hypothetical protein